MENILATTSANGHKDPGASKSQNDTSSSQHGKNVGAASKSGGGSSTLSQEFQNFVSDIEDLITSSTSLSGDDLKKAKDKIQERIGSAKEALESATQGVVQRGRAAAAATHEYVSEEPWKAVGIAAGLGFLLGLLASRR